MRKFIISCIDNETNLYMIYNECSFNMAMYELEAQMDVLSVKTDYIKEKDYIKVETSRGTYYYDERRGYLLKK